jgi:hypothetical protein
MEIGCYVFLFIIGLVIGALIFYYVPGGDLGLR